MPARTHTKKRNKYSGEQIISVRLPLHLITSIEKVADKTDTTVSHVIRYILERSVKHDKETGETNREG